MPAGRNWKRTAEAAVLLLACAVAAPAAAGEGDGLPRWEFGVGVAGLAHPDYRGSDHMNLRLLPLPYLVYRGERLQFQRDGLRFRLFGLDRARLSISAAASLPGDDDAADSSRSGMPELDPTFEIGPSLDIDLNDPSDDWYWRLRVPVRAVIATDFSRAEHAGWLANPHLTTRHDRIIGDWRWRLSLNAGGLWATQDHHDYFYAVDPVFATPSRPAYRAAGGYSGARFSAGLSARRGRWRIGLGVVQDLLHGASFEDSPLVETRSATLVGLGVAYELRRSRERVRVDEE